MHNAQLLLLLTQSLPWAGERLLSFSAGNEILAALELLTVNYKLHHRRPIFTEWQRRV